MNYKGFMGFRLLYLCNMRAKALGHGKVSGAINRGVKELLNKQLIE